MNDSVYLFPFDAILNRKQLLWMTANFAEMEDVLESIIEISGIAKKLWEGRLFF